MQSERRDMCEAAVDLTRALGREVATREQAPELLELS